ncbi:CocE/NonD family hydrolase [Haliea sp. E1-2-M8]|uniref:CocE/NonD family hydrolase n=1 Tax=Haliea sp. E1-2-M8 TaxID=3064706 RepID=UPI002716D67A|nr:CocE/NonD family hydrolase [Haliea sp. E1-2-M8]MDO8863677.1 CocE/NonD family hydrolase [Haliea sp. E1-2-M8]
MKTVTELPFAVEELENIWIPMADGARLAARIWMPENARSTPVPGIIEYIPYRKRFGTAGRDTISHPFMAGHGYACVRVDLRGSGESDGVLTDEYLPQELDDGCEVIRWLVEQPWCDGNVGMMGISWGGFNGLQIAAMRPPALKAVISLCSTDDRYADDVHHMGGCMLGDNLSWSSVMFDYNALPPDPALVGERWRDMWLARLEGSGLWLAQWLHHQRRDAYWKHGSICEDFDAVRCPVYAISGWADGYSNAVFRLLANLPGPCKGLIGPWSHAYPHIAQPGPAIDFLGEALRWWDYWLKDIDTGIMAEPALRVWMQDSVPPTTSYVERPGRWVAEPAWPSPTIEPRRYALSHHHLVPEGTKVPAHELKLQSPLTVGLFAGKWCSYAAGPDLAHDQRREDGGALVFQTSPLYEDVEIMGPVVAELTVSADKPVALLALRLSDVQPDDKVTRVTYGLLNLTHRVGSAEPEPLEPGKRYCVRVTLNDVAHRFPRGHRLRLSVSTSYWPLAWPSPEPVQITLYNAESGILVPVRPPRAEDQTLRPFGEPRGTPPPAMRTVQAPRRNWLVHMDLAEDTALLEVIDDAGTYVLEDIGLEVSQSAREWYSSVADDVNTVRGETLRKRSLGRGDWQIHIETRTVVTSTPTHFHIVAALDAYEGDKRIFSQNWDERIARDLV